MLRDPHQIVALYHARLLGTSTWRRKAMAVRDAAQGNLAFPLPELGEHEGPAVANLVVQGIDQTGLRIASVPAQTKFFAIKPGVKAQEQAARSRTAAFKSLHHDNAIGLSDRRRARWYVTYGSAPVLIRPMDGKVVWEPRDPLSCFPAPSADPDAMMSDNVCFAKQLPFWWLKQRHPEAAERLRRPSSFGATESVTVIEYVDSEVWGLYAASPADDSVGFIERVHGGSYPVGSTPGITHTGPSVIGAGPGMIGTEAAVTLVEIENKAGVCPLVNPQRICVGEVVGQFDQMVDIYVQQAKLMALELNAVTESVFPPMWAIQNANEQLEIVTVADGKRGIVGEIKGGTLQPIQLNPGFQTYPTIDRLERIQRLNGGIPNDFSGESGNNIRTGRRGEQVLDALVSFPVQEAQESFQRSKWHENMCAIAVGKANFGAKQFFFGSAHRGRGQDTWSFNDLFPNRESTDHEVKYPVLGTDANGGLIRTGQRLGLNLISLETARELDPEIEDPELEKDRIDSEAMEAAMLSSIQQQAASGAIPPADVARITQLVRSDRMDLADAILFVQKEAQERQAELAPPGSPETQPGLALPGMGAEQPALPPPGADMAELPQLLAQLRTPQQFTTPQENSAATAALIGG